MVQPLERLYNSTFQKGWQKTVDRIILTSPGDLEEMDRLIKKLERLYEMSGIKKLSMSLGTYPDEYANRIKSLRYDLCETIGSKFRKVQRQIEDLIRDPNSFDDYDADRKSLDEAVSLFRMLRAFYKRWKLYADDYRYAGERFDFSTAQKGLAYRLARKRMVLMQEHAKMRGAIDYKRKLEVLDEISGEVSKLFDWYRSSYLNIDGKNVSWIGSEGFDDSVLWMPVDFLDADPGIAPLERFRNVPTTEELSDTTKLFDRFVDFYHEHDLVGIGEIGAISDYMRFNDYAANFSLYSDNAEERLKAELMEQMLTLHKVVRDVKERVNLKGHTENMLQHSFAMYFAPVDEIYAILQRGFISSEHSLHHKISGKHHDQLIFDVDADIKDGDIGFIFPLTKVVADHRFYQVSYNPLVKEGLSESNTYLHVFSHTRHKPLKIDIRQGIFIAPKSKTVSYVMGDQLVKESSEQYFRKFFSALAADDSGWFESGRLQNWISRHCVFYDDSTRGELLNMLRNKDFVSIINRFTNLKYDNLALSQIPGTLKPTEFYVTHKFERMPDDKKEVLGGDTFNLTLFEWERRQDE